MTEAAGESIVEKNMRRTGECVAMTCRARCDAFVLDMVSDGFRTCTCGHTQIAHKLP